MQISPFGVVINETEKPKFNIFNHNIVAESQPADTTTANGPLFSQKNPWFQENKSEQKPHFGANMFFNNKKVEKPELPIK